MEDGFGVIGVADTITAGNVVVAVPAAFCDIVVTDEVAGTTGGGG